MEMSKVQKSLLKALILSIQFSLGFSILNYTENSVYIAFMIPLLIGTPFFFLYWFFMTPPTRFQITPFKAPEIVTPDKNHVFNMINVRKYIAACVALLFLTTINSQTTKELIIRLVGTTIFSILIIIRVLKEKLIISPETVTYQTFAYSRIVKWEDLEAIKIYSEKNASLIFRDAKFTGNDFSKGFQKIYEQEKIIPLQRFSKNWREDELGDVIRQHVQGLEL